MKNKISQKVKARQQSPNHSLSLTFNQMKGGQNANK